MQRRNALLAALFLALGSFACGYDSNGTYDPNPVPDSSSVVGSYGATVITNTVGGKTTDLIEFGLVYSMTLKADRTMKARFVVSTGTAAPGNPFDVTGTWALESDSSISVTDNANTFLSGIVLNQQMTRLEGVKVRGESAVRLVLERQPEG